MDEKDKISSENNQKEEQVFDFVSYDTKGFFKSLLLGVFIGLAVVIPGISGAAIAIMFKLYDKLIYAIGNITNQFKKCFKFLLPIIIGVVIGFVVGFFLIKLLLDYIPLSLICLFAGLMVGALPIVFSESKGDKWSKGKIALFIIGLLIPLIVGGIAVGLQAGSGFELAYGLINSDVSDGIDPILISTFGEFPFWIYIIALPIGFVLGMTQVIPGLSATAFLMMIGYYKPIMSSISLTYFKAYPQIFGFYAILLVGAILGFIIVSKILNKLFAWNRKLVYRLVIGLSIGSIIGMFINPDVFSIYYTLATNMVVDNVVNIRMIVDLALIIPLAIGGYFLSHSLVKMSEKKG